MFFLKQHLEQANAEEFFEIYKGVVAEYEAMVNELSSGTSVALEITGKDDDTPSRFREFCGPSDPVRLLNKLIPVLIILLVLDIFSFGS